MTTETNHVDQLNIKNDKWKNDNDLFPIIKTELCTDLTDEIMDELCLLNQFLPPKIKPLHESISVTSRAMTILEAGVYGNESDQNRGLSRPFGLMLEALDDLKTNEVYLCSGSSPSYTLWEELMATRAQILGVAGAIVDGYSRATKGILTLNFPAFSYGSYAKYQAPRDKVIGFRGPLQNCRVSISPEDILVGDIDCVCEVPKTAEDEVFRLAIEKARSKKIV